MRSAILSVAAYAAGFVATLYVYLLLNGIEGDGDRFPAFYAVFCVLLGGLVGRWWLLPLPALHLYVVDPWRATADDIGPFAYVLVGTVGIAIGIVVRLVVRRRTAPPTSAAPAPRH